MKKVSKVLLVALIGLGSVAAVPAASAEDVENCWGRCDTNATQDVSRMSEDTVDVEACWGRCDTDGSQDPQLYPELFTWHDPAGKDEERETMASYR